MARRLSSIKSVTVFPGSNWSGRTMATTRGKSKPPLPKFRCCASKSSSAATTRKALSSCRAAGSSSELSLGLAAIAASPRITKISPGPSPPSSHWPASRSPSDDSRDSCLLSQALRASRVRPRGAPISNGSSSASLTATRRCPSWQPSPSWLPSASGASSPKRTVSRCWAGSIIQRWWSMETRMLSSRRSMHSSSPSTSPMLSSSCTPMRATAHNPSMRRSSWSTRGCF
jgi:hypothetical protein